MFNGGERLYDENKLLINSRQLSLSLKCNRKK